MDSKHNPFTDLQRCNVRCNVRYKMTGTLSMRTSSACLMRWMRRTPCENTSKGQFVGIGSTETYTAQRALLSARRMTLRWGARGSLLLLAPFLPQAPAARPCPPGRRETSVLEHALKQPGGSQMRKQMRSTFPIPGTEDGNVKGNAPRSGGAEAEKSCPCIGLQMLLYPKITNSECGALRHTRKMLFWGT
jgi:hypothetical protein